MAAETESFLTSEGQFCQNVNDGIYADVESDCHKFYVCEKTQEYKFSCPEGHRFFQRFETCSYVSPEEEHTFACEEMSHDIRQLHSQSIDHAKESENEEGQTSRIDRRVDDSNDQSKTVFTEKHLNEYIKAVLGTSYPGNDHFHHESPGEQSQDDESGMQSPHESRGHIEEESRPEYLSRKQSSSGCRTKSGSRVKRSCRG